MFISISLLFNFASYALHSYLKLFIGIRNLLIDPVWLRLLPAILECFWWYYLSIWNVLYFHVYRKLSMLYDFCSVFLTFLLLLYFDFKIRRWVSICSSGLYDIWSGKWLCFDFSKAYYSSWVVLPPKSLFTSPHLCTTYMFTYLTASHFRYLGIIYIRTEFMPLYSLDLIVWSLYRRSHFFTLENKCM